MIELQGEMNKLAIMMSDFDTLPSGIDMSSTKNARDLKK